MRILIVEDEVHLADALAQILKKHHYSVDLVHDGQAGLDHALSGIYDLFILDIMLPGMDGLTLLRTLRAEGVTAPVIMLTARDGNSDTVAGLDLGADDYMTKPFAADVLLARIRAALRRRGETLHDDTLRFGGLELQPSTLKLICGGRSIKLILKEYELMELLMSRRTAVTSKDQIIEKLWGFDSEAEGNNVEVYVSFLRKKLTHLQANVRIQTIRGVGYVLEVTDDVR